MRKELFNLLVGQNPGIYNARRIAESDHEAEHVCAGSPEVVEISAYDGWFEVVAAVGDAIAEIAKDYPAGTIQIRTVHVDWAGKLMVGIEVDAVFSSDEILIGRIEGVQLLARNMAMRTCHLCGEVAVRSKRDPMCRVCAARLRP